MLRDRLDLPGGGVLPGVSDQMRFVSNLRNRARRRLEQRAKKKERIGGGSRTKHKTLDEFIKRAEVRLKQCEEEERAERKRQRGRGRSHRRGGRKQLTNAKISMKNTTTLYRRVGRRIRNGLIAARATRTHVKNAKSTAEQYYHLQHRLTKAAIVIQRFRRNFVAWRASIRLARSNSAVVVIQRHARGFITRQRLTRWWARRIYLVCVIQGVTRGILARRKIRTAQESEHRAARLFQSCWRRYRSKKRTAFALLSRKVVKIQRAWRGSQGRARADKIWLDAQVVKIQKITRGFIHGKVISEIDSMRHVSKKVLDEMKCIKGKQGFSKNIEANIKTYRRKVTADKLDVLFNISRETRRLKEATKLLDDKLDRLDSERRYVDDARERTLASHFARVEMYAARRRTRAKRKHLADQRRRWSVRYFRPSGKPDRKRRYGRPWDKSVFADPLKERMLLTGDFFTVKTDAFGNATIPLSQSVQLQNSFNQFQMYGALLKPLMSRMGGMSDALGAGNPMSSASSSSSSSSSTTESKEMKQNACPETRQDASSSRPASSATRVHSKTGDAGNSGERDHARTAELKRQRNLRRMKRRKYRPSRKVWSMLDELDNAKGRR
eukprot:g268.t1